MNILFSISYYSPYVSGLTLCARRIAESFAKSHMVTLLTMRYKEDLSRIDQIGGVQIVRAQPQIALSKGFFSFDWVIRSFFEAKKADVIFVNLPQFEGVFPAFFGRLFGKKVIAIYHCEVLLPKGFFNTVLQTILKISNRSTVLLSHEVITYTKDYARYLGIKRARAIYPPIPLLQVSAKKHTGFVIGVAARLAAEKGIEYVLEALLYLPNVRLLIAGTLNPVGETVYKKKIFELVKKYKKQVQFLGEIHPEHMATFYASIDVLVLPSINSTEAFGMVQVEAMLCGVPVIATDLPGVRVPIRETGMGIIVPPKDVSALVQAITAIRNNYQHYTVPKQKVASIFSINNTIQHYTQLLN